ncbi:hypothetical protein RirG_003160 [Rhizophagus irregularis DAOM 197198w]|uniref:Uncharacterized protein n=1 Tax=Rhizophagus irregularis (strain DAOM 197198w) TaxID=1432141 RepID=A0A015KJ93_RHIIW|nr:hypothetical protein RirG_003160 [Rhizophagus irregularis DAOM 197198w]
MYNYAILTYEKRLLGETPVKAIELSDKELVQGDSVYLVGIGGDHSPVMKKTIVTSIGNVGTKECSPPRWRAMNEWLEGGA